MSERVSDEPAFVLHRYDWSESSLILEVLTRRHGRVALVAKGAKKPSSNLRPVLLPLQPLRINYSGDGEIRTLKAAEWVGGYVMPTGDALLSGYYINELLLRLLARDDAHPRLFDTYAEVVRLLACADASALQPALRVFELLLLREVGLLPALDTQTLTQAPLEPTQSYVLVPEGGLRRAHEDERAAMAGPSWERLEAALGSPAPVGSGMLACAELSTDLKPQLRQLLHYHCGVASLRTRQLMMDLQSL